MNSAHCPFIVVCERIVGKEEMERCYKSDGGSA